MKKDYLIYYIPTKCETIMVYEGSGENLIDEDKEQGYNDYVNYYTYLGKVSEQDFHDKDEDWDDGSRDSGMWCFNNEEFPYENVGELIDSVIDFHYGKPLASIYVGCAI